ncbi:nmrA-like family domain-containing protein 1 [Strongylocentrotus purpuratus]|uniref:NmrA-like family domain-containing protein 1 n=1 Tax=Strongylocentrotus purpuratus TaxID=7668 RepID=A0A7M7T5R3_STRPU|nr:nmrA-like family domain-containing protein 1 [Strongylocentrotus purpuratus]
MCFNEMSANLDLGRFCETTPWFRGAVYTLSWTTLRVEVLYGDYDDHLTLDDLMADSYGVYVVTGAYIEKFYEDKEVRRGLSLVQAAIRAGVQHFVYSGLPSCMEVTGQKCPESEGKSKVEDFLFASELPSTSLRQPISMENILIDFIPLLQDDGTFVWNIPMEGNPLPVLNPADDGRAILTVFKNPKEYIGRRIGLAGDCKTMEEYAAIASKHVTPFVIKATKMTASEFKKLDSPRAADLGAIFQYFQMDTSAYSLGNTKQLDANCMDFDSFMQVHAATLKDLLGCQSYDETTIKESRCIGFQPAK